MTSDTQTTREQLSELLRDEPATASTLATELHISTNDVHQHIEHIAQTLTAKNNQTLLVAPPVCKECGFNEFQKKVARPSRCPQCRCERVEEPSYTIETTSPQ